MPTNTYVALDTRTVTSPVSTIDFTSIPQGYTDLVLVLSGTKTGVSGEGIAVRVGNGTLDTGSNYSDTILWGTGSTAGSARTTSQTRMRITYYAAWIAGTISVDTLHFMNYSNTTTFKTVLSRANTASQGVDATVSTWRSTSAINTISVYPFADSFAVGTTATLYGIASTTAQGAKAEGGIVTSDANYWYHTFRATDSFRPLQSLTCDYLVVAGGGGGGNNAAGYAGGGGGAGGLRSTVQVTGGGGALESPISVTAQNYTITVGAGGTASANGTNSVFSTITATAGGGGANGANNAVANNGATGGSGGGGGTRNGNPGTGGTGGSGTTNQGYAGGNGRDRGATDDNLQGGGGGGAGTVGGNGAATLGGLGGNGVLLSTFATVTGTGINNYFAGGGGGGSFNQSGGTGGLGGGGIGGNYFVGGSVAGTSNTGSGGGGGGAVASAGNTGGANGGSGIVIIRYAK